MNEMRRACDLWPCDGRQPRHGASNSGAGRGLGAILIDMLQQDWKYSSSTPLYEGGASASTETLWGGEAGCPRVMHGRTGQTINPRILTTPGRGTPNFHQPGRHCLHQSAKRREVLGELREG